MYPVLTDAHCRNAICPPDRKQARFTDAGGLYLQVSPSGSKRWFYKYRPDGKEKQLALGGYPAVGLRPYRGPQVGEAQRRASHGPLLQYKKTPMQRLLHLVAASRSIDRRSITAIRALTPTTVH